MKEGSKIIWTAEIHYPYRHDFSETATLQENLEENHYFLSNCPIGEQFLMQPSANIINSLVLSPCRTADSKTQDSLLALEYRSFLFQTYKASLLQRNIH